MKAIGFFFAVFFSMLAVFLVATGEVSRWLSTPEAPEILVSWNAGERSGPRKNILDFDFWDVRQGRRKFTLRAELRQDVLQGTSRIEEIQEISLKDGIIEIPIYREPEAVEPNGDDTARAEGPVALRKVELDFARGVYRRKGGLAQGSGRLEVLLYDGSGKTDDGGLFSFEELFFFNDPDGKSRGQFEVRSDKRVEVDNDYLRVVSPTGLSGTLSDDGGFEYLRFLPPVTTYLKPQAASLFALGSEPSAEGEAARPPSVVERTVAITSQGPLELFLADEPITRDAPEASTKTDLAKSYKRINFENDVRIYDVPKDQATTPPPEPSGNWLHCQRLELMLDSSSRSPRPTRAKAVWPGGRVKAYLEHKDELYTLSGEELTWVRRDEEGGQTDRAGRSEARLSGSPTLEGGSVQLAAERATLDPGEGRVFLEAVDGRIRVEPRPGRDGDVTPAAEKLLEEMRPPAGSSPAAWPEVPGSAERPGSEDGRRPPLAEYVTLRADTTEIFFRPSPGGESQELSHFVAQSEEAHGVVIEGIPARSADDGAKPPQSFRAEAKTLRYREGDKLLSFEGTPLVPPRLSRGESWIEGREIHLLVERNIAWFERDVSALLRDLQVADVENEPRATSPPTSTTPEDVRLEADYLVVYLDEKYTLEKGRAMGSETAPVSLTGVSGPHSRFRAPEIQLDALHQTVRLTGTSPDGENARPARMELEDSEVLAGDIFFDKKEWKCMLRSGVEMRLYSGSERSQRPDLEIHAGQVDVEFFPRFAGLAAESRAGSERSYTDTLRAFKSFHGTAEKSAPLNIEGKDFVLRGQEATWDSSKKELRFFGPGLQEIELLHEQLRGPVRAREIVYDSAREVVTLRGSVKGEIRQHAYRDASVAGRASTAPARPLTWEFETSVLEIELARRDGGTLVFVKLRARDKVVLSNVTDGIRLRGDDLEYDHLTHMVRVFSEDGRPQTLTHYADPSAVTAGDGAASDPSVPVNRILAQEIWVLLYQTAHSVTSPGSSVRTVLVQFHKDVIATFRLRGGSLGAVPAGSSSDPWKLHADALTLQLDPAADARSPQVVSWALATGNVVCSFGPYQASATHAEYEESRRRLALIGSRDRPASIVDTRQNLNESAPGFVLRKTSGKVVWDYLERPRVPRNPWPALPQGPR